MHITELPYATPNPVAIDLGQLLHLFKGADTDFERARIARNRMRILTGIACNAFAAFLATPEGQEWQNQPLPHAESSHGKADDDDWLADFYDPFGPLPDTEHIRAYRTAEAEFIALWNMWGKYAEKRKAEAQDDREAA